MPLQPVPQHRFPGVPLLHGAWRACQDRRQPPAGAILIRPQRDVSFLTPGRLLVLILCLLLTLCTGCSTYGRAVSSISAPIAKAHADAHKAKHSLQPQPQENPPCTALTPCP